MQSGEELPLDRVLFVDDDDRPQRLGVGREPAHVGWQWGEEDLQPAILEPGDHVPQGGVFHPRKSRTSPA